MLSNVSNFENKQTEQQIGLIIVTHADLGASLLRTVEAIMGKKSGIKSMSINHFDNHAQKRDELIQLIDSVETGKGVALFTDLFGGTPSNIAMSVLGLRTVEVLAGVNLPMVIKFIEDRDYIVLPELMQRSMDAGRRYIQIASTLLGSAQTKVS